MRDVSTGIAVSSLDFMHIVPTIRSLSTIAAALIAVITMITMIVPGYAAESVRIEAPTGPLTSGQQVRLQVVGTIERAGVVEIELQYPATLLRVESVVGGSGFLMTCPEAQIISSTIASGVGSLRFRCTTTTAGTDQPIAEVIGQVLVGASGTGSVVPTAYALDYVPQTGVTFSGADIDVQSQDDIGITLREGITGNYPNPMGAETRFVYTVLEAQPVQLSIRNLQGRLVRDLGTIEAAAGENQYLLLVAPNELSQGAYVLQVTTRRGSYLHPFMKLSE